MAGSPATSSGAAGMAGDALALHGPAPASPRLICSCSPSPASRAEPDRSIERVERGAQRTGQNGAVRPSVSSPTRPMSYWTNTRFLRPRWRCASQLISIDTQHAAVGFARSRQLKRETWRRRLRIPEAGHSADIMCMQDDGIAVCQQRLSCH